MAKVMTVMKNWLNTLWERTPDFCLSSYLRTILPALLTLSTTVMKFMGHGSVHAEEHLTEKPYRKGPELLVDTTLTISQQYAHAQKAANGILGFIRNVVSPCTLR